MKEIIVRVSSPGAGEDTTYAVGLSDTDDDHTIRVFRASGGYWVVYTPQRGPTMRRFPEKAFALTVAIETVEGWL